jgi:aldose sugar dehydrogenase
MPRILLPLVLVCLLLLVPLGASAGCAGDEDQETPPTTQPTTPQNEQSEQAEQADEITTEAEVNGEPLEPATEEDLEVSVVAEGLNVPWEIRFLPEGDLLVTERAGRLVRVELPEGRVTPLGELPAVETGEGGLMGLALHPDFPDEPYLYVAYTYQEGGDVLNRVSRFIFEDGGPGAEEVLLDAIPGGRVHNGSRVAFGPDGNLWITTGDAGRPALSQDEASPAGKILRLTAEGEPVEDNPIDGSPVYALGLRNAQGLTWHPVTEQPFVTEHGPDTDDELNAIEAGGNYGWPEVGGSPGHPDYVDAIISWTPSIAPAGAVFYDADEIPGWRGSLLFVTLKESDLRRLVPSDDEFSAVAEEQVLFDGQFGRLRAIAVGPDGAVYVATSNRDGRGRPADNDDRILRIAPREG